MAESAPASDEKTRQRADAFFQYGNDAVQKENYGYALDMYTNALKLFPRELRYRQALRGATRRKLGGDPAKIGMLVGAKLQPIRLRIKTASARGQWDHVLELCEEAFLVHPWDVQTASEAAEAAEQLGWLESAQWLLESVQAQAGTDIRFWKQLARIHERREQWQTAILCWEKVKKISPRDEDAARQINGLSASATIARAGLKDALNRGVEGGSGPDREGKAPEDALRPRQLSPEQKFEQEAADSPVSPRPYLDLADHYRMSNRLDEAREVLGRGLKRMPNEPSLLDAYAEVQLRRLDQAIDGYKRRLAELPQDTQAREKLVQLTAKRQEYELADLRRRLEAQPSDSQLRYDLGRRLAAAGRHEEAIAEFQQARSSPVYKVRALIGAGASFEATGILKLAERSYQEALKAIEPEDQENRLELHYRLGRVAEGLDQFQEAEQHYNEVAAVNYAYQDVATRLKNLHRRPGS